MATYVVLVRYTHQGVEHVKASPERLEAVKKGFHRKGAEVRSFYCLMGEYDSVLIVEAPSDELMAQLALGVESKGNVRTETLRAFTEDEFRKIVAGIS
jgi:uncharacterized protein with GYD domain